MELRMRRLGKLNKVRSLVTLFFLLLGFQAFATNEFQLSANGRIIVAPANTPVQNIYEATQIMNRLKALNTSVLIPSKFGPENREIVKSLRQDINALRRNRLVEDQSILNRVRVAINALQAPGPSGSSKPTELSTELSKAFENVKTHPELNHLKFNGVQQMRELSSKEGIPSYCKNYPSLDREELQGYYGQVENGAGFTCFEINQDRIGLDLSTIGDALLSIEEGAYEKRDESLRRDIMLTATAGALRESAAYAGYFEGTDPDLSSLRGCAACGSLVRGNRVNPPNQKMLELIDEHKSNLENKVQGMEKQFSDAGLKRKDTFIKEHIKQALIIGNLYEIKANGEGENARRNYQQLRISQSNCREQVQGQTSEIYSEPELAISIAAARCPQLIESGRFEDFAQCRDQIVRNSQNPNLRERFEQCVNSQEKAANYNIGSVLPVMAKKLAEYPILFNREDNSNLIPFTQSESNFVPSEFSKKISSLPGAFEISSAIKDLLLSGVEDPDTAIDELLEDPNLKDKVDGIINKAMQDQEVQANLKDEVKDYRRQVTSSAEEICKNDGDYLHHFPELVNEVIARRLNAPGLTPRDKQKVLAQSQSSQCHLLQIQPPDEEGGLPVAYQAVGVVLAIGIGLVPGVGTAIAAAAIGAVIGVSDGIDRNAVASDRLAATEVAFSAGFASSDQVLDAAGNLTDSRLTLGAEALLVGGEGLSLLSRATRSASAASDVARTPASPPPTGTTLEAGETVTEVSARTDAAPIDSPSVTRTTNIEDINRVDFDPGAYLRQENLSPDEESQFITRLQRNNPIVYKRYLDELVNGRTDNVIVAGDFHIGGRNDPNGERFEAFLNHLRQNKSQFTDPNSKVIMMGDVLDLPGYSQNLGKLYPEIAANPDKYYVTSVRKNSRGEYVASSSPNWDAIKDQNPELWKRIRNDMVDTQMETLDQVAEAAGISTKQIQTVFGNHELPTRRGFYKRNPDGSIPLVPATTKDGVPILDGEGNQIMVSATIDKSNISQTDLDLNSAQEIRDAEYLNSRWAQNYNVVTQSEEGVGYVFTKTTLPSGEVVE